MNTAAMKRCLKTMNWTGGPCWRSPRRRSRRTAARCPRRRASARPGSRSGRRCGRSAARSRRPTGSGLSRGGRAPRSRGSAPPATARPQLGVLLERPPRGLLRAEPPRAQIPARGLLRTRIPNRRSISSQTSAARPQKPRQPQLVRVLLPDRLRDLRLLPRRQAPSSRPAAGPASAPPTPPPRPHGAPRPTRSPTAATHQAAAPPHPANDPHRPAPPPADATPPAPPAATAEHPASSPTKPYQPHRTFTARSSSITTSPSGPCHFKRSHSIKFLRGVNAGTEQVRLPHTRPPIRSVNPHDGRDTGRLPSLRAKH